MIRSPQCMLVRHPFKEDNSDSGIRFYYESKKEHGVDIKTVRPKVDKEVLRNRSIETNTTVNSNGIHSVDLLMNIYPSISDSESDHGKSEGEEGDNDTIIYMNRLEEIISTKPKKEEATEENLPQFRRVTSPWVDDKPFDEESQRAPSEIFSDRSDKVTNEKMQSKRQGFSKKFIWIACILAITSFTGAVAVGFVASWKTHEKYASNHQATESMEGDNEDLNSDNIMFLEEPGAQLSKQDDALSIDEEILSVSSVNSSSTLPLDDSSTEKSSSDSSTNSPSIKLNSTVTKTTVVSTTAPRPWNDNNQPSPAPTNERTWGIVTTYFNPIPEDFFPLGFCAGDCDRDADCDEGLICFQRGANDPVPFCNGGENDYTNSDYCTYPSYDSDMPESESSQHYEECFTKISVVQDCLFWTEDVIVVSFENCNPKDEDWIGVYPDGTTFDDGSPTEWASNTYIDWAFTCGDTICDDSPSNYSFAFPTDGGYAYDFQSLRVYLLRNTSNGPPYKVIAKTESFTPKRNCQ